MTQGCKSLFSAWFFAWLRIWRFHWFGRHHGWPHFAVYLTGWLYFSNHTYKGERRYWVRIGEWRRSFGGVRRV